MISILLNKNVSEKSNQTDELIVYRSVFKYINSNMYAVKYGENALVIDPHEDEETLKLLNQVKNVTILLTHEHPDHISGIHWIQENFSSKLVCTKACASHISNKRNVRPILITFVLEEQDKQNGTNLLEKFNKEFVPYTYKADITFDNEFILNWCSHKLDFFKILGHSKGSCGIIVDEKIVFTGDTLLKDYPVITRLPGGSKKSYISETIPKLEQKLNPDMWILPGHGEPFYLKEIMKDGKIDVEFR